MLFRWFRATSPRTVFFGPLKLGRLLDQHLRIEDAHSPLTRYSVLSRSPDQSVTYVPDRSSSN